MINISGCKDSSKEETQTSTNTASNSTIVATTEGSHSTPLVSYENGYITPSSLEDAIDMVYDSTVTIECRNNSTLVSTGSGTIFAYDTDLALSYVLTCYHVIEGCQEFSVVFNDTSSTTALLVGGDKANDIAVLSIEGLDYSYASMPSEQTLRLGQQIFAVGNPLGSLPGSVTVGHISYLNREVTGESYFTMNLIQTDVAVNSGNSGGGMFDLAGRLVGVINAKYSDDGIEGLGFAIPISTAMEITNAVFSTASYDSVNKTWKMGYVEGAYELGFTISDVQGIFQAYPTISATSTNSTSSGYGVVKVGDQIVGVTINKGSDSIIVEYQTAGDIYEAIYSQGLALGDSITLSILRGGRLQEISFEIVQFMPQI